MDDDIKRALKILCVLMIVTAILIFVIYKISSIEQEHKDDACEKIGYEGYLRSNRQDYCIDEEGYAVEILLGQNKGFGYKAVKIREEMQE